jgi:hypothetical protein
MRIFTPCKNKERVVINLLNKVLHNSYSSLHIIRETKPKRVRLAQEMNLRRKIEGPIHTEYHENSSGRLGIFQRKTTNG